MIKQPQEQSVKQDVLNAINSGEVTMRPKWQFTVGTAALIFGFILLALTTLYLTSFIVFVLRETGVWFVPGFGFEGIGVFLTSLPWVLLVIAIIFIALLEILIRRYSFSYGRPFVYSALGIIVLVVAGGVIIGYTSFHENLYERAEHNSLPLAGPFYHHFGQMSHDITVGTITELTNNGYEIEQREGQEFLVVVSPQTEVSSQANFKVGDVIVVLGQRNGNTIQAAGIQESGLMPPPAPPIQLVPTTTIQIQLQPQ